MTIQLNTDKTKSGDERLEKSLDSLIKRELQRFSGKIVRIEVHLSDKYGGKKRVGNKRCMLVAWLEHRKPIAITNHGNTLVQAISGALVELKLNSRKLKTH